MRSKGLGNCACQLLLEVSTVRSMDLILPVKNRGQLRMRLVRPTRQTCGRTAGAPGFGAADLTKNHSKCSGENRLKLLAKPLKCYIVSQ